MKVLASARNLLIAGLISVTVSLTACASITQPTNSQIAREALIRSLIASISKGEKEGPPPKSLIDFIHVRNFEITSVPTFNTPLLHPESQFARALLAEGLLKYDDLPRNCNRDAYGITIHCGELGQKYLILTAKGERENLQTTPRSGANFMLARGFVDKIVSVKKAHHPIYTPGSYDVTYQWHTETTPLGRRLIALGCSDGNENGGSDDGCGIITNGFDRKVLDHKGAQTTFCEKLNGVWKKESSCLEFDPKRLR